MKLRGWIIAGVAVFAGIVSYNGFRAAVRAGEFTTLTPRFDGTCVNKPGAPGAEDIVADRERRLLYVSSDDRRAWGSGKLPRGRILALSLDNPDPNAPAVPVSDGVTGNFHPHGLGLWVGPAGERVLMVVNHPNAPTYAGSTIEIYDVGADGAPQHRRTVAAPWLRRPNDVVPVGPDQFYVTNETDAAEGSLGEALGFALDTDETGAVWYFDGSNGRSVATGLTFANSVEASRDGTKIYATSTVGRALYVYARDRATGGLNRLDAAFIGTGVDNISVDNEGRLWIASHPKLYTFSLGHARDAAKLSPSQVILVEPEPSGVGGKVDQVYLSDGQGFSGASAAVHDGNQLIMGAVFEDGLRVCQLPAVWKHSESAPARRLVDPLRDEQTKEDAKKAAGVN